MKTFRLYDMPENGNPHPDIPELVYVSLCDKETCSSISGYVTAEQRAYLIECLCVDEKVES